MRSQINRVLEHLRQAALAGEELTDVQLLELFLAGREEFAFEALVRRFGPMVLGVCRRVAGHAQDAEDAFQATFLVLARKAIGVWPREKVGNWLYGVAYRIALKARAATQKRQAREKPIHDAPEPTAPLAESDPDWLPLLDRELHGLPAKYRVPIVLCDLQGKTQHDAARQLGWPQGTLSGRLSRAHVLLGQRLARRGFTLGATALASALAAQSAAAHPPESLLTATVKAAGFLGVKQALAAGAISGRVAALSEGVLKSMMWNKLKTAMIGVVALAVVVTGLGRALYPVSAKSDVTQGTPLREEGPAAKGEVVSPQEKDLHAKLKATDNFNFNNQRLDQLLDDLRKTREINIVVDHFAIAKEIANVEDLKVSLRLKNVPLETALRHALNSVEVDFVLQGSVMVVTSRDKALTSKVYPVASLVGDDDEKNGTNLIITIKNTIEPLSWSEAGGNGTLEYFSGTKSLVVRQSWDVHRAIADLLRELAVK